MGEEPEQRDSVPRIQAGHVFQSRCSSLTASTLPTIVMGHVISRAPSIGTCVWRMYGHTSWLGGWFGCLIVDSLVRKLITLYRTLNVISKEVSKCTILFTVYQIMLLVPIASIPTMNLPL